MRVDPSVVDVHDVLDAVREDVGTQWETFVQGIDDVYAGEARSAYRSLASGLLVFAAVAGVVGLLAVLQAVRRHVALGAEPDRILGVLGMTRRQRAWAIGGPSAMAAAAGIIGGAIGAVALSPLFPLSVARRAISRGVDADIVVLAPGAALLAVACPPPSRRARGAPCPVAPSPHRVSGPPGSAALCDGPVPPGASASRWRSTPAPGHAVCRRGRRCSARCWVSPASSGRACSCRASTPAATSRRYGWTWDSQPDLVVDDPEEVVGGWVEEADLATIAVATCGPLRVGDLPLFGCAFDDRKGSTGPPITAGRPPTGPGEVALGRVTMEQLGISLGETVQTTGAMLTVVGQAVIPLIDNAEPGEGRNPDDGRTTRPPRRLAVAGTCC